MEIQEYNFILLFGMILGKVANLRFVLHRYIIVKCKVFELCKSKFEGFFHPEISNISVKPQQLCVSQQFQDY